MKEVVSHYNDLFWSLFDFLPNLDYDSEDLSIYYIRVDKVEIPSDYKDEDPIEINCITNLSIDFYNHRFYLDIHFEDYEKWNIEISSKKMTEFLNKLIEEAMNDEIPWPYMKDLINKEDEIMLCLKELANCKERLEDDIKMI